MAGEVEPVQGRVIRNRYELIDQLGHGGMGSVWRAKDRNLDIDVAVKLIRSEGEESPEARARFEREALAAAQLRSTHIVLITDNGVDADTPFIVMELLRGESLAKRLKDKGRLSFEQTLQCFSQIGEALAFAHERKIIHRDLKPDNVFIVSERNRELVKVLDFGVAKKLDAQSFGNEFKTHTGALLGTPYYMSPEQARGIARIDHRADIWSFGVMAYECLTGLRPFEADTLPDLLMAICRDPHLPPSHVAQVPLGFDEWFARATAREPAERFGSIEEALSGLSTLQGAKLVGNDAVAAPQDVTTGVQVVEVRNVPRATAAVTDPATRVGVGAAGLPPHRALPSSKGGDVGATSARAARSVMPSSVTSPGLRAKQRPKPAALGLWSALVLAIVGLGYWFWRAAGPASEAANTTNGVDEMPARVAAHQAAALPSSGDEMKQNSTPDGTIQPDPAATPGGPGIAVASVASSASAPSVAPVARAATEPNVVVKPSVTSTPKPAMPMNVKPWQSIPPSNRPAAAPAARSRPAAPAPSTNSWGV